MRIIVTADTHLPLGQRKLPDRLLEACESADLILHAGDWKSPDVYAELSRFAEVKGVFGNVDGDDIRKLFPEQQIIETAGHRIGLVHGHGKKQTTEKRARDAFLNEELDMIIYGHSHIPHLRYYGKTMLLNPGSPTDKRKLPLYSFAVLTIGETIHTEFIFFS